MTFIHMPDKSAINTSKSERQKPASVSTVQQNVVESPIYGQAKIEINDCITMYML
jgi:hypothetical protein